MTSENRLAEVEKITAQDPAYKELLQQGIRLEQAASRTISTLPQETQDLIWAFILHCEEMSRYVLRLACANMHFPDEQR